MVVRSNFKDAESIRRRLGDRAIVLVGLMGAGKSTVGRRLADKLGLPFVDADHEIEAAAGKTIPEIFADHGEAYFREGERKVIARLLDSGAAVLATGGGALGVQLGGPMPGVDGEPEPRPDVGLGDAVEAEVLPSAVGLVWRALIVWLLLVFLLSLANWTA